MQFLIGGQVALRELLRNGNPGKQVQDKQKVGSLSKSFSISFTVYAKRSDDSYKDIYYLTNRFDKDTNASSMYRKTNE